MRLFRKLYDCERGQFAVWFAILAFPLLIITTLVVDIRQAQNIRQDIANALDSAALAAVTNQKLSEKERESYARDYFFENLHIKNNVTLKIDSSKSGLVDMSAEAQIPTTIVAAIGQKYITVKETAAATLTKGQIVCFLVLDPHGKDSFDVSYASRLRARTCSVQVNSNHNEAARAIYGGLAEAKDFCVTGGGIGAFAPFLNTECAPIQDPYEHLTAPDPGACNTISKVHYGFSSGNKATLKPGHYCSGLDIVAMDVNFEPGIYTISGGPMVVNGASNLKGDGVTFVISGKDSYVEIGGGSTMTLKASNTGPLAGLVFFQTLGKASTAGIILPNQKSQITGGGAVALTGTAYFPTHKIHFNGGSILASQAPSTSFIGYQVAMSSGAEVNVAVDHKKAGLPPILPRSDESARLVK